MSLGVVSFPMVGISMLAENGSEIIRKAMLIKAAVNKAIKIEHPFEEDLSYPLFHSDIAFK